MGHAGRTNLGISGLRGSDFTTSEAREFATRTTLVKLARGHFLSALSAEADVSWTSISHTLSFNSGEPCVSGKVDLLASYSSRRCAAI